MTAAAARAAAALRAAAASGAAGPAAAPAAESAAEQVPGLPEAYAENARALCEQRIGLAGYRLAHQLSLIFRNTP